MEVENRVQLYKKLLASLPTANDAKAYASTQRGQVAVFRELGNQRIVQLHRDILSSNKELRVLAMDLFTKCLDSCGENQEKAEELGIAGAEAAGIHVVAIGKHFKTKQAERLGGKEYLQQWVDTGVPESRPQLGTIPVPYPFLLPQDGSDPAECMVGYYTRLHQSDHEAVLEEDVVLEESSASELSSLTFGSEEGKHSPAKEGGRPPNEATGTPSGTQERTLVTPQDIVEHDADAVETLKIDAMLCESPNKTKRKGRRRKPSRPSSTSSNSKRAVPLAWSPSRSSLSEEQALVSKIAHLQHELRNKEDDEYEVARILAKRVERSKRHSRGSAATLNSTRKSTEGSSQEEMHPGLQGVPEATLAVMKEEEKEALGRLRAELGTLRAELRASVEKLQAMGSTLAPIDIGVVKRTAIAEIMHKEQKERDKRMRVLLNKQKVEKLREMRRLEIEMRNRRTLEAAEERHKSSRKAAKQARKKTDKEREAREKKKMAEYIMEMEKKKAFLENSKRREQRRAEALKRERKLETERKARRKERLEQRQQRWKQLQEHEKQQQAAALQEALSRGPRVKDPREKRMRSAVYGALASHQNAIDHPRTISRHSSSPEDQHLAPLPLEHAPNSRCC